MIFYQIKIVVKQYKTDEFVKSMRSFARRIRKEKGCLGYIVYRDFEKEYINAVAPQDRAKAMAACILAIHILGDVPSPPLVGYVSDLASLEKALLMVPIAALVCSVIWLGSAVIGGRERGSSAAEPQRNPDRKGL